MQQPAMILPHPISFKDELPIATLPAIDRWSENYAFVGYDYASRIGYAAYAGRWVKQPTLWREQLYLYLPDGTMLQHQAIGPAPDPAVPTAGALRFHCDEPGGQWRILFDGGMRHDRVSDLLREPIRQSVPHPVSFSVTLDHGWPVWMFGASENSSHGKFHYEQLGQCSGRFHFAGQDHVFTGPAYRDHSRGPRHLGGYQGHAWLQLFFEDRPAFASYQGWAKEGGELVQILDQTVSIHADGFRPASLESSIRLTDIDALPVPLTVDIAIAGEKLRLVGQPQATLVTSLTEEFDFFYGFPASLADIVATEQPYMFDYDGGRVRGYLQRSLRVERSTR